MESRGHTKDGVIFLRGSTDGHEVKVILPGAGKSNGIEAVKVGELIWVKPPSWEIDVDGTVWVVAVDWHIVGENG